METHSNWTAFVQVKFGLFDDIIIQMEKIIKGNDHVNQMLALNLLGCLRCLTKHKSIIKKKPVSKAVAVCLSFALLNN